VTRASAQAQSGAHADTGTGRCLRRGLFSPSRSCLKCEPTQADEVVGARREDELGPHLGEPSDEELAHPAHRLHPAEDLLDDLAPALTDPVALQVVVRPSMALWRVFSATWGVMPRSRVAATKERVL